MSSFRIAAVAALFACVPATSAVAASPEQKCYLVQLKSLAGLCKAHADCWSDAITSDLPNACLTADLEAKPATKIAAVEGKLECIVEGDATFDAAAALIAESTEDARAALDPGAAGEQCGADKMAAVGKFCSSILKCHGKDFSTAGAKPAAACITKATAKMTAAFVKAEQGSCATSNDATTLADAVESSTGEVIADSYLGITTTTSTTTTSTTTTTTTSTTLASVCEPDQSYSCYTGPAGTQGVGICSAGTQICNSDGSALGSCNGQVLPGIETCTNPQDEDCDGQANESGSGCVCSPSQSQACYTGPAGTQGVGTCKAGLRTCNAQGTGYGACAGQVTPVTESCANATDDDCDGQINEGCPP